MRVASGNIERLQKAGREDGDPGPRPGRVVAFPTGPSRDTELFEGLKAGKTNAIAGLFDRYAPLVRRLITRMLSDAAEADDLTQETLLVVVRRAKDIRSADAIRPFVMSVAVRTAKNELRRRSIRRWIGLDDTEATLLVAADDPVTREQVGRLRTLLERLSPSNRALFLLRHVEQLELTELSETFGCSLATIKRRIAKVDRQFSALALADEALRHLVQEAP